MATVIVNNPVGSNVIATAEYTSVWAKPYWTAAWQYIPYLIPLRSLESAAPSDSTGEYSWDAGTFLNLWEDAGGTLLPINLENWIIKTQVHTVYGSYISWIGVVVGESYVDEGVYPATGVPRAVQTIECRGLEYLLERRHVIGTYVGTEEEWVYLSRTRTFNKANSRRETLAGNRSAYTNAYSRSFLFGDAEQKWSNLDIIYYLFGAFQPWVPIGNLKGQISYVPLFRLSGQISGLDTIFEEHDLHGMTVRDALNRLIDRRRGFGWKIVTDGVGPIYIHVFSLSQNPIFSDGVSVPANARQVDVPIHDDPAIQATLRISSLSQVDEIVVESDTPVYVMATLGMDNGSLEPAWNPALDSDLTPEDTDLADLAQALYDSEGFDNDWWGTGNGFISFTELYAFAEENPGLFAFIGDVSIETVTVALHLLDTDGDSWISPEDLEYLLPAETYQAVEEEERATDRFGAVFSEFQVPKDFTWTGHLPAFTDSGHVITDGSVSGAYWNRDMSMNRFLFLMEPGFAHDVEREYMEPFGLVVKPDRTRDIAVALANAGAAPYTLEQAQAIVTDLSETEFDALASTTTILWSDLYTALADNPAQYVQLDRAHQLDYPECSLGLRDSGLGVVVKSEANHVFGLNHFDPTTSEIAPEFDYETLLATVTIQTDIAIRARIPVYASIYESIGADGSPITTAVQTPTGRQIYIQVPGKHVWFVAPWTVTALDGGMLEFFRDGVSGLLRDDSADIRAIAALAYIWYGQQRASAEFVIANLLPHFAIGDMVRSTISGWFFQQVGTCVTAIECDYQEMRRTVTTGYSEMDPGAFSRIQP